MILKECVTDRLSSKLWIGIALIALVIMPLSVRAIWAEPTKQSGSLAQAPIPSVGSTDGSKPHDAVAEPPAKLEEQSTTNLDERMRRLEATVEKLARIVEASQLKIRICTTAILRVCPHSEARQINQLVFRPIHKLSRKTHRS